jgi:hypothetical protein
MKFLILGLLCSLSTFAESDLRTVAEKSGWKSTGRAVETQILCKSFQKRFPKSVSCRSFGRTPEGRDLLYIIVGDRNPKNSVLWVQAGIHAGEIDGKDAVFWLMKDALTGGLKDDVFKGITMIFVPIVNLDGHERFGKWNRPNQVGPEEMGWRTTSQNYNLNRDFMKADAPEMRSLIKLWRQYDPIVSLDLHVTNGAQFRPEVGVIVTPTTHHGGSELHKAGKELEEGFMKILKSRGHLALPYYPSFEEDDRPSSGLSRYVSTPRFSQGYWYVQDRIGVLVETHSWKDYATRVKTHYSAVLAALEMVQKRGTDWTKSAMVFKDLAGTDVALSYKHTNKFSTVEFPGYQYEVKRSKISGADVIKYFPEKPESWKVPFYEELVPDLQIKAPTLGYYVSGPYASIVKEKLELHGVRIQSVGNNAPEELEAFRATKKKFSEFSYEGHQPLTLEGEWKKESVKLPPGSIFVPIKQKHAHLIMQLLEPRAPDSLISWGFLNTAFEPKEYMEDYVVEDVAREMLKDPKIKAEFEQRLEDAQFAKDPKKRFEFFYRKHPSWDVRLDLAPIYRI